MIKMKFWITLLSVAIIGMISTTTVYAAGVTVPYGHTFNVNTSTLNANGDVNNEGTLQLDTGVIMLNGNWSNYGVFSSGTGAVVLNSTFNQQSVLTGGDSSAFYVLDVLNAHPSGVTFADELYCDTLNAVSGVKKLSFSVIGFHTIFSTFNVNGSEGNLIELASLTPSVDWNLDAPTSDVNYLSVSHSQEIDGKLITAYNSVNGGNNMNWKFIIPIPDILDKVGDLDPGAFKNPNNQNALINKLNAVMDAIDNGDYVDSLNKLKNDILKRMDGCGGDVNGSPDKNDWITDCDAQAIIYPVVLNAIALLEQELL